MESEKRWYVIHTYSGYENKVSANLERKVHSLGMENEDVRNLQTYLKGIADYSGVIPPIAVTGVFDEATRDAVAALQAQNDLPPTGNVGPATWNLIRRSYNAR